MSSKTRALPCAHTVFLAALVSLVALTGCAGSDKKPEAEAPRVKAPAKTDEATETKDPKGGKAPPKDSKPAETANPAPAKGNTPLVGAPTAKDGDLNTAPRRDGKVQPKEVTTVVVVDLLAKDPLVKDFQARLLGLEAKIRDSKAKADEAVKAYKAYAKAYNSGRNPEHKRIALQWQDEVSYWDGRTATQEKARKALRARLEARVLALEVGDAQAEKKAEVVEEGKTEDKDKADKAVNTAQKPDPNLQKILEKLDGVSRRLEKVEKISSKPVEKVVIDPKMDIEAVRAKKEEWRLKWVDARDSLGARHARTTSIAVNYILFKDRLEELEAEAAEAKEEQKKDGSKEEKGDKASDASPQVTGSLPPPPTREKK